MPVVRTLLAVFDLELPPENTRAFKGAWNQYFVWVNEKHHGHDNINGGYTYEFPEVQFRSIDNKAAIMALNEEADAVMAFFNLKLTAAFTEYKSELNRASFSPDKVAIIEGFSINRSGKFPLRLSCEPEYNAWLLDFHPKPKTSAYIIRDYLPFPRDDEQEFKQIKGVIERNIRIQQKLANHIKDFTNAIKWDYDKNARLFDVTITGIRENETKKRYDHHFLSYDIEFSCDLTLPPGIGIGPKKRLGHGVIEKL